MKLVVDTNLWLSGSLWDGAPARLLDAALTGAALLFLSAAVRDELQVVRESSVILESRR